MHVGGTDQVAQHLIFSLFNSSTLAFHPLLFPSSPSLLLPHIRSEPSRWLRALSSPGRKPCGQSYFIQKHSSHRCTQCNQVLLSIKISLCLFKMINKMHLSFLFQTTLVSAYWGPWWKLREVMHTHGEEESVNMHLCALTASGSLNSSSIQWGSYVIQVWLNWREAHDLLRWIPRVTSLLNVFVVYDFNGYFRFLWYVCKWRYDAHE